MKDKEKEFKERIACGIAYCEDTTVDEIKQDFKMQEKQNVSMKEMLTKRSFEPITNCNCKVESRIDYAVRKNEDNAGAFANLLNQEINELLNNMEQGMQIRICNACKQYKKCDKELCTMSGLVSKELSRFYQPKIPEDSVVLPKEEYELLTNDLDKGNYGEFESGFSEGYKTGSKETAEKCWQMFLILVVSKLDEYYKKLNDANRLDGIREVLHKLYCEYQDELARQFNIEIKE